MIIVGLTGGIGSGKSTISGIFRALGAPVYNADAESKKFLESEPVARQVIQKFGKDILTAEGWIDRKRLAAIVFSDPERLSWLNSLLHPAVISDFSAWAGRQRAPYIIQEAAIIFESGIRDLFDQIVHVSCPEDIAIQRVVARDHTDESIVRMRMKFQLPEAKKRELADHVILNDGTLLVIPQVLELHRKLSESKS